MPDSPTPNGSEQLGIAGPARKKKRGRPFKTPTKPISAVEQTQIAAMSATGVSIRKMAAALKTDHRRVRAILDMPSVGAMTADFRQTVRLQALHGIQQTQEDVWRQVGEAAKNGDARDFRDWTGGALNLEKIAYSASGESRPQVTLNQAFIQSGNPSEEARQLVRALGAEMEKIPVNGSAKTQ